MKQKDLLPGGTKIFVVYPVLHPRFLIEAYFIRCTDYEVVCADVIDGFIEKYPIHCCFLTLQAASAYMKNMQGGGQA